jgi:hypothetical protein
VFDFLKRTRAQTISFEEQLRVLGNCGITLYENVAPEVLFVSLPREEFENTPFETLLCAMGSEAEVENESEEVCYLSDSIWHFDAECIYDHGSYAAIARRLAALAHPDLPLEDIDDYVDVLAEEAWLSFKLDGRTEKWVATVTDDWVDSTILTRFAALLEARSNKRFTYINLGGTQDFLIGCATPAQRAALIKATNLDVDWLA